MKNIRKYFSWFALFGGLLVFALLLVFPSSSHAAAGEGSATIDIQGEGSPGSNQNIQIAGDYDIVIVLTVGASGIAADGNNIQVTIPAGWTAPQSSTATAAGYVTVTSSAGTVAIGSISGQEVNINVTGALSNGNTVTFRYGNKSSAGPGSRAPAAAAAAAEFIVKTDDTGANSLAEINGGTSPTVTVYGTITLTVGLNTSNRAIVINSINNNELGQFALTAAGEAMTVTSIIVDIINNQGFDFPANRFMNLKIIHDASGGDDYSSSTDTVQCGATKSSVSSLANITFTCATGGSNISIASGQTKNFFLVVDTTSSWILGETARASINTATDITATGGTSGVTSINATAALPVQGNILHAYDSAKRDRTPPAAPTELSAIAAQDSTSVHIAWKNPSDTDLAAVYLLRSKDSPPSTRSFYKSFGASIQEYIDLDVKTGDKLYYALYVEDLSGNQSDLTSSVLVTIVAATPSTPQEPPTVDVAPVQEQQPEEQVQEIQAKDFPFVSMLNDKAKLTRGEAAQLIAQVLELEIDPLKKRPYRDVSLKASYAASVGALKKLEIVVPRKNLLYKPKSAITKAEFLAMLIKALKYKDYDVRTQKFQNLFEQQKNSKSVLSRSNGAKLIRQAFFSEP